MVTREGTDGLRVDLIDVGQGDSLLLEGPSGETMLVDSGHYYERGKQVLDHLDKRDIDSLDYLVATHDDWDHIGGHAAIIEELGPDGIGEVCEPTKEEVSKKDSKTRKEYENALTANGYDGTRLEEGDAIEFGDVAVDVFNPSPEIDSQKQNENSLVLQATYDEQSILLAGDVEDEAETQLIENHTEQLSDVDVLKVAHHGSKYSTGKELIETCEPETVLYSHAEENKHDHPNTETVTRTAQADTAYSTALHGTTSLEFDGQNESPLSTRLTRTSTTPPILRRQSTINETTM